MRYTLIICLTLVAMCLCSTADKETPDWTGTTQGQAYQDSAIIHFQNCMRLSEKAQREIDSIDNYMRHWYEVLDTNSDGDIDDTE